MLLLGTCRTTSRARACHGRQPRALIPSLPSGKLTTYHHFRDLILTCSCSDFIPKEKVPDPQNLHLWIKINGQFKQRGATNEMIFPIPRLIEHISSIMTLEVRLQRQNLSNKRRNAMTTSMRATATWMMRISTTAKTTQAAKRLRRRRTPQPLRSSKS